MSVELIPHAQLGFERPFNRQLSKPLSIHNPHSRPIGFKIKTTAPKQYCVRPNSGRVESGETVEVSVILQPMKEDPPLEARCKDKFLVQSAIIPVENEVKPLAELWSELEQTSKSSIHEQKIRCAYLSATSTQTIPELDQTIGEASRMDESTYIHAPSSLDQSKSITNGVNGINHDEASSPSPTSPSPQPFHESTNELTAATSSTPLPIISTSTAKETASDLLAAAKKEIERLKAELAAQTSVTGLRKRTNATTGREESVATQASVAVKEVASTGVPVPVVAVISFAVFLITYLYF